MTANLEREIGEMRSDVRHVQASLESAETRDGRLMAKLEELVSEFHAHASSDDRRFADVATQFATHEAEKRGERRVTAIFRWVMGLAIGALAAVSGGHIKLPGLP